jgi:DNA invertase Pin-like site-specific DNA recombinase
MKVINSKWERTGPFQHLTIGYLRVSTEQQTVEAQKLAILEYSYLNSLVLNGFLEVTVSSSKSTEKRRIDELLNKLQPGDTLVVSELSRLGRSTVELLTLIKQITSQEIKLIVIKQNLIIDQKDQSISNKVVLTVFSMLAEIEKELVSQRTKEGLIAARSRGKILGKSKGTIQPSVFDPKKEEIVSYLRKGLTATSIGKLLGLKPNGIRNLSNYIRKRKLN